MKPADRLPWPAVAAALVSFAALYRTVGGSPALLALGFALVAAGFSPFRLERGARWIVRSVLFALIAFLAAGRAPGGRGDGLLNPELLALIGELSAAELVIRAWRRYDSDFRGENAVETMVERLFAAVGCSAVVFLAASNTSGGAHIRWLAPAYLFFLALSLRGYRGRASGRLPRSRAGIVTAALRAGALALALSVGGGAYAALYVYRAELINWGSRFIGERLWREGTGMSSTPTLGPTFNLRGSPVRVLRVENDPGDAHLRGMSFDIYTRGRWGPSGLQRHFESVAPGALRPDAPGPRARITRLREGALLFAPLSTAGLRFPGEHDTLQWAPGEGGPLRLEAPPPYTYEVIVAGDAASPAYRGPLAAPPDAEQRARCLAVPPDIDPRVRRLAQKIAGGLSDPRARVRAVEEYLRTHHAYSTTIYPGPGDPVSNFLLQRKNAHCEFFASAAAILLRCVGVPTRYVTGYLAHESAGPNALVVRQRDAHAWAESWIADRGWMTVEATPGDGRPDGFDEAVPLWRKVADAAEDALAALRRLVAGAGPAELAGLFAAVAVAYGLWLLAAARLARRHRPAPAPPFAYTPPDADLAALGARFDAWLRRRGSPCPAPRTWREHLSEIEIPEAARDFVAAYDAARFGEGSDPAAVIRLRDLLRRVEEEGGPHPPAPSPNSGRGGEESDSAARNGNRSGHRHPLSQHWERGQGGEGLP